MAADIRFYLDENVPVVVAEQLQRRGIEAITVRDIGRLDDSDENHLNYATNHGYILCTYDTDYVELVRSGIEHVGLVIGQQHKHQVGDWVRFLELLHATYTPEDVANHVEYL